MDAVDRLPQTGTRGVYLKQHLQDKLLDHTRYIRTYGQDTPEVSNWRWAQPNGRSAEP